MKDKKDEIIEELKRALFFYSDEDDWNFYCDCCADGSTALEKDHGKLAREILQLAKELEQGNEDDRK